MRQRAISGPASKQDKGCKPAELPKPGRQPKSAKRCKSAKSSNRTQMFSPAPAAQTSATAATVVKSEQGGSTIIDFDYDKYADVGEKSDPYQRHCRTDLWGFCPW